MQVMVEVFELAASHDRCNAVSLAASVKLGRRWQSKPEAHGKNPKIPIYEMADKFLCYNRRRQLAAPVPYTYVAKVVRERAEIDRQTSKAKASKNEAE
eukprot:8298430-Pyramimonas_sp.AAC.1